MNQKIIIFCLTITICLGLNTMAIALTLPDESWLLIKKDITYNISGIALIQEQQTSRSFLVVHDNKSKNYPQRVGIVTVFKANQKISKYTPLSWPSDVDLPRDLEAVTTVPTREKSYMVLASTGKIYHLQINLPEKKIELLSSFDLPIVASPIKVNNFESLAIQEIDGELLIVWAHRGSDRKPGVIYWGILDLPNQKIIPQGAISLRVPFPEKYVRHISDLKIDSEGVVYISSAQDPGDNGPFASAIYLAGTFAHQEQGFSFTPNSDLVPLYQVDKHKIEAIELLSGASGGIVMGTDDENFGAWVNFLNNVKS